MNLFTYTKTEGQGWLVEKPEMDKPDRNDFYYRDLSYESDYFHEYEYNHVVKKYNDYLSTLRRFKYDYPDPKKEMELGKDFEMAYVLQKNKDLVLEAIPITQRMRIMKILLDSELLNQLTKNNFSKPALALKLNNHL